MARRLFSGAFRHVKCMDAAYIYAGLAWLAFSASVYSDVFSSKLVCPKISSEFPYFCLQRSFSVEVWQGISTSHKMFGILILKLLVSTYGRYRTSWAWPRFDHFFFGGGMVVFTAIDLRIYPTSHNHESEKWVPPIVTTFQLQPFSTSMIMGERVKDLTRK